MYKDNVGMCCMEKTAMSVTGWRTSSSSHPAKITAKGCTHLEEGKQEVRHCGYGCQQGSHFKGGEILDS